MIPLLPFATAHGSPLARVAAWHAGAGRRIDGVIRWAIGLGCAAAVAHAVVFGVAFAVLMWREPIGLGTQVVAMVFWAVLAAIAGGVQLLVTFTVALPAACLLRRLGPVTGALAGAALLVWLEGGAAWVWIALAPSHRIPVAAITVLAAAIGLLWGSWLPAVGGELRSDRA